MKFEELNSYLSSSASRRKYIQNRKIPDHLDGESLYIRIGLHTGPCVGGIAGVKTPRYLLFGETVDIASHIEASGEKMMVHMSSSTADLLAQPENFIMQPRGEIMIKGTGSILTYWLSGKAGSEQHSTI